MVLVKKVAFFDWERGQNSGPREGQKIPWTLPMHTQADLSLQLAHMLTCILCWT